MKQRKKRSIIWTMPKEQFTALVADANSIADVLRSLGMATTGKAHRSIKERIEKESIKPKFIPTSGYRNAGTRRPRLGFPIEDVAKENSSFDRKGLKKKILKLGLIDYSCSVCHNNGLWENKPLVLVLDHVNGIRNDNRLSNLRFLCPNCNSQQSTFSGRNRPIRQPAKSPDSQSGVEGAAPS